MRIIELSKFCADLIGIASRTAQAHIATLQNAGLIAKGSRGRYGGADLGPSDGINAVLACTLDAAYGESVADVVNRVRALHMTEIVCLPAVAGALEGRARQALLFCRGLSFDPTSNLGATIDSIIADHRSGTWTKWTDGQPASVVLDIFHNDAAMLSIERSEQSIAFDFRNENGSSPTAVERIVRLKYSAFKALSNALGSTA